MEAARLTATSSYLSLEKSRQSDNVVELQACDGLQHHVDAEIQRAAAAQQHLGIHNALLVQNAGDLGVMFRVATKEGLARFFFSCKKRQLRLTRYLLTSTSSAFSIG